MFDRNYHLMRDHWFIPKVLLVFVITCMIFAVFYKGFDIYFSKEMKDHIAGKALFDQKNGKIAWLIIMLVWIPNYISYLPGVFTVDAINQIEQFASHNLTNHHPILTTFIEAPIVLLGKHLGHLGINLSALDIYILILYYIKRLCMDEQAPYTVCDPDDHVGLFLHLSYLVCICKNLSKGYIVLSGVLSVYFILF